MAEAGQHEEGPGPARPQRPPPDLQRRAHSPGGDQTSRAAASRTQAHTTGENTEKLYRGVARGLQRDVVYLGLPIPSPLVYEPKCGGGGGGGGVAGSQSMSTAVHRSSSKRWRSNSVFNLLGWPLLR